MVIKVISPIIACFFKYLCLILSVYLSYDIFEVVYVMYFDVYSPCQPNADEGGMTMTINVV